MLIEILLWCYHAFVTNSGKLQSYVRLLLVSVTEYRDVVSHLLLRHRHQIVKINLRPHSYHFVQEGFHEVLNFLLS